MASNDNNRVLEATLTILKTGNQLGFADLARRVIEETRTDEATAKASILRLRSDGRAELTLDWVVRVPQREKRQIAA
jgi:hypothetical protein